MITDLIASGQAKIDAVKAKAKQKEAADGAATEAEANRQMEELNAILANSLPAEVLEVTGRCTELPVKENGLVIYRIEAPECTAVSFCLKYFWQLDENNQWKDRFGWIAKWPKRRGEYGYGDDEQYTYNVETPGVQLNGDEDHYIVSVENNTGTDDLEVALAYAHEQWLRFPALREEVERKNAQLSEKQAREQEAELAKNIAQARANRQLAEMMADPIMGPLLRMVNAIMQERADTNQRIADMSEALETTEYYHSEAIGRMEKRVSEEARRRSEAEREAENERYAASEAQDKLKKATTRRAGLWG